MRKIWLSAAALLLCIQARAAESALMLRLTHPSQLETIHLQLPQLGSNAEKFKSVAKTIFPDGDVLVFPSQNAVSLAAAKPSDTGWHLGWLPLDGTDHSMTVGLPESMHEG